MKEEEIKMFILYTHESGWCALYSNGQRTLCVKSKQVIKTALSGYILSYFIYFYLNIIPSDS